MKKLVSLLLTLCMIVTLLPTSALAAEGDSVTLDISSGSITITETGYSVGGSTETAHTGGYVLTGSSTRNTVTVASGSHSITLQDLQISINGTGTDAPFSIYNGASATATLLGANKLTVDGETMEHHRAAVRVPVGATLTITEDSTGSLFAESEYVAAGIGGNVGEDAGTIIIHGGTIEAIGEEGAAIGGGGGYPQKAIAPGNGGTVIITGGNVTATAYTDSCFQCAAGIGGGGQHQSTDYPYAGGGAGTINISGGYVNAIGDPGIGCAHYATQGGNITITGGFIEATGVTGGEPIGAGHGSTATMETSFSNCVIFTESRDIYGNRDKQGVVYGNTTLDFNYDVPVGATLTIPEGATLTVPAGVTLNSFGAIQNNGTLTGAGTVYGAVDGNPPANTLTYAEKAPAVEVSSEAELRDAVSHEVWDVKLTADIELSSQLLLKTSGRLDGNGHTITLTGSDQSDYINVSSYGNAVDISNLTLTAKEGTSHFYLIFNEWRTELRLTNCLITGGGDNGVGNNGEMTLTDCTISNNKDEGIYCNTPTTIIRCLVTGNGIGLWGSPYMQSSIVAGNAGTSNLPGGLYATDQSSIINSVILGNLSNGTAYDLYLPTEAPIIATDSVVGVSLDGYGDTKEPETVLDSQINEAVELSAAFANLTTATVNGQSVSVPVIDNTKRGVAAVTLTPEWAETLAADPKAILSVTGYNGPFLNDGRPPEYGVTVVSSLPYTAYYSTEELTAENYLEKSSIDPWETTLHGVGQKTLYYYIVREGYPDVAGSTEIVVTKGEQGTPDATGRYVFNAAASTIPTVWNAEEYSVDGGISWTTFADDEIVVGATAELDILLRYREDNFLCASPAITVAVEQQEKPTGVTVTKPTAADETGTISGITADMEYRLENDTEWTEGDGNAITDIPQGTTYLVRTKAVDNYLPSDPIAVTVEIFGASAATTPNAAIDYENETLTGLSGGVLVDGTPYTVDGTLPIRESWFGKIVAVIQRGDGTTTNNSAAQTLSIAPRPAAPTVSVTDETYPGAGDGKLGTDSTMKYRLDGTAEWIACDGETTGLAAGTYFVRLKAADSAFAGISVKLVVGSTPAQQEATPTAAVSTDNSTLEGFVANGVYAINGTTYTADGDGKIPMSRSWHGMTLQIVKEGNGTSTTDSEAQYLTTPYVATYSVTYDVNGGTGIVADSARYAQGDTVPVRFATIPQKENGTFLGWATSPDAATPTYTPDGTNSFIMGSENVTLYAVWGSPAITYLDENGDEQTCYHAAEITESSTAWSDGWYVVSGTQTIADRITVTGDVKLILADGCDLTAQDGISVSAGNTLTVYCQSGHTGALTAGNPPNPDGVSGGGGAAIGGDRGDKGGTAGTVIINGGNITANVTVKGGACIGSGGWLCPAGTVTINGGYLRLFCSIGGEGAFGASTACTINGGVIDYTSGNVDPGVDAITGAAMNNCVVIQNSAGTVHGDAVLDHDYTIPAGTTLTIPVGATLTVPEGVTLTNNGIIKEYGSIVNNGTVGGTGSILKPSAVTMSFQKDGAAVTEVSYGDTVTLVAAIEAAETNRAAAQDTVDFYLGTADSGTSLGTANVESGKATLEITLDGDTWAKGFAIGKNTITAVFGGSDTLLESTGTAALTVNKADQAAPSVTINYAAETLSTTTDMEWSADGASWTACTEDMAATALGWDGSADKTVKFRVAGDGNHNDSAAQSVTIPARPAAPTGALTLTKSKDSVTVTNANPACEYFIDGAAWNDGIFTNLTAGTQHTVQFRFKATATDFHSAAASQGVTTVNTDGSTTLKPGESVTANDTTITNHGDTIIAEKDGTTTTITPPSGGDTHVGGDGNVTVPSGSTVQTDDGPVMTLPAGGTVDGNGAVTVPVGGTVTITDGADTTIITLPSGGAVTPSPEGGIDVPAGTTVQTGEGPVITLPESGDGGTVQPGGSVVGTPIQVDNTLITISKTDPTGEFVTTDKDGNVTLPGGTTATVDQGDSQTTVTVPQNGDSGTVKPSGELKLPGDSTVTIVDGGDSTAITLPGTGGTVTPGENGEVTVPGGSTVTTGGQTITIPPESSGTVTPGGEVTYTVTVTFDAQGGSNVASQIIPMGSKAAEPEEPTLTGHDFDGWYTEAACTTPWDFDTVVTASMTLYAKWTKKTTPITPGPVTPDPDDPPAPAVWENPFTDVQETDWYYAAVEFANEDGLFYGTSNTTFEPNGNMTRGMLATVLYRLAEEPETAVENLFSDVANDKYYTEAIAWAAENDIVAGYGNGRYGPDDPITREQLAAILWRYAQKSGGGAIQNGTEILRFSDTGDVSDWAKEAMTWAVDKKIIQGKGSDVLDPRGKATRAEVAAMLMRYCEEER